MVGKHKQNQRRFQWGKGWIAVKYFLSVEDSFFPQISLVPLPP